MLAPGRSQTCFCEHFEAFSVTVFHVEQDLTGLESMDQCRRTLEQHNWNIEVKLQIKRDFCESVYIFIPIEIVGTVLVCLDSSERSFS